MPSQRANVAAKPSVEAVKTYDAIRNALHAVQTAVKADWPERELQAKSPAADLCPSPSPSEDLESVCGTECTESTVCSLSDFGGAGRLADARRSLKERMHAEERSVRFARGLLAKLDELRIAVGEDGSETIIAD